MKIFKYITILAIGLVAIACSDNTDDYEKVEDHFMAQPIPQIPVDTDYIVGSAYISFEWNEDIPEAPTVGMYDTQLGDPTAYAAHVDQAINGGIDYFFFNLRSAEDATGHDNDKAFIANLQSASNAASMNFALTYNFGALGLSDGNRIEDAGKVDAFLNDFTLMLPYMQQANYMKIDGKAVVQIRSAHDLYANDNAALYTQLREHMSALGQELYIIGATREWTPPARYEFRFIGGVDAVTGPNYYRLNERSYDRFIMIHKMLEVNWSYQRDWFAENGVQFVPNIVPSKNPQIINDRSKDWAIVKEAQYFSDMCNVARVTTGTDKLIILDSFNDWNNGTQIEAATSYGEEYLEILREEFKVN